MEIQDAIKDLNHEISEMDPQEAIEALEELYRALPNLIFLLKLTQLKDAHADPDIEPCTANPQGRAKTRPHHDPLEDRRPHRTTDRE